MIHHFYFQHPSLWFLALHLQTVCSNVKSTNWLSLSKVLHSVLKGKAIDDSAGNTWSRSTSAFMKPLSSAVSGEKLQFNLIKEEKHQQKNNQSRKFSWEYRGIFIYLLVFKSTAFYAVVVFTLFSRLSHVVTLDTNTATCSTMSDGFLCFGDGVFRMENSIMTHCMLD